MHTKKHRLVSGVTGMLLVIGTIGRVAPVAADDPQVGVIHDTSIAIVDSSVTDDPSDRTQPGAPTTTGNAETASSAANSASPIVLPSVNAVSPAEAVPNVLPSAQNVGDADRNLIQNDDEN